MGQKQPYKKENNMQWKQNFEDVYGDENCTPKTDNGGARDIKWQSHNIEWMKSQVQKNILNK